MAFLDDDDWLLPSSLSGLLRVAGISGADFRAGNFSYVTEDESGIRSSEKLVEISWTSFEQLLIGNVFPIGSFIAKKQILQVPFNLNLKTHEDWLFLIDNLRNSKVVTAPFEVLKISKSLGSTREQRNSASGERQKGADYARIYALHPAPHLSEIRQRILSVYGVFKIEELISG